MKSTLYTLLVFLSLSGITKSQTVIYSNDFTAGNAGWQLGQGNNFDTWIVNNIYTCSSTTPNQGGGNYLHIYDDLGGDYCAHCGFYGTGSAGQVYATMTSGVNTMGSTLDSIKFDWLCMGQTGSLLASYGSVDYSIDGGISWVNITLPFARYSGQATWTHTNITSTQLPAMLNHSDFRLRFGFTNSGYGTNPAFAIDNLVITGNATSIGIAETNLLNNLLIYPNPSTGIITIAADNAPFKNLFVTITDIQGRIVYTASDIKTNANYTKQLNLQHLANGIYYFKLSIGTQVSVQKLVLN